MSFRLEMLQVARLAPDVLGDATGLVEGFLRSRQDPDTGGFRDRDGRPDLYYSVFGMEGLMALRREPDWEALAGFLRGFGSGDGLDFVHLCSLARLWSAVPPAAGRGEAPREEILRNLERWRSADGGFHQREGSESATAYACLLGCAAIQDCRGRLPDAGILTRCLQSLRSPDGGWGNEPGLLAGSTPATAAAVALHRCIRRTPDPAAGDWLLQRIHPGGGFRATPDAPIPDLLSTAVALHALDGMQVPFSAHKESLLDYVDSLWNAEGGFHGHWADDVLDIEYTYYGLLALGHLAL